MILGHNLYRSWETPKVYFYYSDKNTFLFLFGVMVIHCHNSFLDDGWSLGLCKSNLFCSLPSICFKSENRVLTFGDFFSFFNDQTMKQT